RHRLSARKRFETPILAAPALDITIHAHNHVANLTRRLVPPAVDLAVDEHSAADTRPNHDPNDVRMSASGTFPSLSPHPQVNVIVNEGGDSERVSHLVRKTEVFDPEIRSIKGDALRGISWPRECDSYSCYPAFDVAWPHSGQLMNPIDWAPNT